MAAAVGKRLTARMRDDNRKARELIGYTHHPGLMYKRMERLEVDAAWVRAYRHREEIDGGPLGVIALGSNFGGTLLHLLLHGQNVPWKMQMLLKMGVPVNHLDDNASTVLHAACEAVDHGCAEPEMFNERMDRTVRDLIAGGASMTARDRWGRLPLEIALDNKSPGALRFFTELIESMEPVWNASKQRRKDRIDGEAFAMGHQDRLGSESSVRLLDPCVIKMILDFAGKLDGAE